MKNSNIIYLILIFYLLLFFIPNFGAIDVIGPQWLYLSVLNAVFLIIIDFKFFPRSIPFYLYISFVFFVFLSVFYANNINVALVDFFRIFNTLLTTVILYNIFIKYSINFKSLCILISLCLVIEVLYSLVPFFRFLLANPPDSYIFYSQIYSAQNFIGFAGNKNITAASLAIKLPFLFYLFINSKFFVRFLSSFIFFLVFIVLFFLRTRSVYLSVSFVLLFSFIYFLYHKRFSFFLILIPLLLSLLATSFFLTNSSSNLILDDFNSIQFNEEASNSRIFLWENALNYISEHPFIGCGIGNWKIESIPYWNTHLSSYTVPYHAHNDILEITTELGVFGGLTYVFFLFSIFAFLFRTFFTNRKSFDNSFIILTVFLSFFVYLIDLNLNFPLERTRMQLFFSLLLVLLLLFDRKMLLKP